MADEYACGIDDAGGSSTEDVCRDYLRNVCKRGSRCRFRHPDATMPEPSLNKGEFVFCHDFQNKECMRLNCKFIHGDRQDEEHYKRSGELPLHLQQNVGAGLGLLPTELSNSKEEVPVCRDFLKGECLRGSKCKFRHIQREYEYNFQYDYQYDANSMSMEPLAMTPSITPAVHGYDPYTGAYATDPYEDYGSLLKRKRVEDTQFQMYDYSAAAVPPTERHVLEEEAISLRRQVEELKNQASVLEATNNALLQQNTQFRQHHAKMMTLNPPGSELVAHVANYNHSLAQTHNTLSSHGLQPHFLSQHELATSSGAQTAAQVGTAN